ncbi:MAG: type IX secretion system membrane protein PorP/SprF [Draconibacterium sp.]
MKKAKLLILISLFYNVAVFAQQDPLFTQYTFNKLLVNPAYAGSREGVTVNVINRAQWVNIDGAPNTMVLSAHGSFREKRVGLGAYLTRDAIGPVVNTSLMGTYSYRILMDNSAFSFGLQGGLRYFDYNWALMNLKDADYVYDPSDVRSITPDFNIGVYYQSNRFFAGLSSKQLLENEVGFTQYNERTSFDKLVRHFFFMSGTVFPIADKIMFRPSTLVKFVQNTPVQIDLNASVLFNQQFMVGVSYRTQNAITAMMEIGITNSIRLSYSYDMYFNELQLYNYGSHEIRLEFDLKMSESRMLTPRYF